MNPIPEKGGYAAGGRTVSELPPPPSSVSIREVRPETMTRDDLAATLEEIRRDAKDETEGLGPTRRASKRDVPRLVAALEAVLANHQPGRIVILGSLCKRHENHRHFSITRTEADDVRACPDCTASVYNSCTGCPPGVNVDACVTRLAITREITGKGEGDA